LYRAINSANRIVGVTNRPLQHSTVKADFLTSKLIMLTIVLHNSADECYSSDAVY